MKRRDYIKICFGFISSLFYYKEKEYIPHTGIININKSLSCDKLPRLGKKLPAHLYIRYPVKIAVEDCNFRGTTLSFVHRYNGSLQASNI